jgi:4a-hydroxytetrahydrobiopterin dehydratase
MPDRLSPERAREMAKDLPAWTLEAQTLARDFELKGFDDAVVFVNRVADLAKREDHHPDIHWSYSQVRLELSTHKVGGLSERDFALAQEIDQLPLS